jgi:hypothetical protein
MVCGKQSKPFKNRFVIFVIVKIFNNFMQTVVLQSDSKTDLKLLIDLAKKIGIEVKVFKGEQLDLLTEIETGLKQVKKIRNGDLPEKTL